MRRTLRCTFFCEERGETKLEHTNNNTLNRTKTMFVLLNVMTITIIISITIQYYLVLLFEEPSKYSMESSFSNSTMHPSISLSASPDKIADMQSSTILAAAISFTFFFKTHPARLVRVSCSVFALSYRTRFVTNKIRAFLRRHPRWRLNTGRKYVPL